MVKNQVSMTDNWLSTKFILTVAVLLMSYALVFVGKMDAKTWFEFACIASGIYAGSNVAQKFSPNG
jgi:uncharacterized membrane protein YhdT